MEGGVDNKKIAHKKVPGQNGGIMQTKKFRFPRFFVPLSLDLSVDTKSPRRYSPMGREGGQNLITQGRGQKAHHRSVGERLEKGEHFYTAFPYPGRV